MFAHRTATSMPRYLPTSLAASGLAHAAAVLLVGALVRGGHWGAAPPPPGVYAVELTASMASRPTAEPVHEAATHLEVFPGDDSPANEQHAQTAPPEATAEAVRFPLARQVSVARQGEIPAGFERADPPSAEPPASRGALSAAAERRAVDSADAAAAEKADAAETMRQPPRREARVEPRSEAESVVSAASRRSEGAQSEAPPQAVYSPQPEYPAEALAARQTGRVVLRVAIGAEGAVVRAEVRISSGVASLDRAALAAVRRWRFQPVHRTGDAASAEVDVPIRFVIE
jgi:protein TonB